MNFSLVKSELLVALRGNATTQEISVKLGYAFNQVGRWENGKKHMRWSEFCAYCEVVNAPLGSTLQSLLHLDEQRFKEMNLQQDFLRALRGHHACYTNEELCEKLHCHPSVLKRLMKDGTPADLQLVFALMDLSANWLSCFVYNLLGDRLTSGLRELFEREHIQAQEKLLQPLAAAVEMALTLEGYQALSRHEGEFIASKVGASALEVNAILTDSLRLGTVTRDPSGKYFPTYQTINTNGLERQLARHTLHFWSERSALRLQQPELNSGGVRGLTAYRVAPASRQAMLQIQDIMLRANQEILRVLEEDTHPPEDVRVILMHSFNANDLPKSRSSDRTRDDSMTL